MAHKAISPAVVVVKAAQVALADGPLHEDELAARLAAAGVELGARPASRLIEVLDPDRFPRLIDERFIDLVALAEGAVFSHQLTAQEVADGEVEGLPDLGVLDALTMAGLDLSAVDGLIRPVPGDDNRAGGPPDGTPWLAAASEGDLLTVAVEGGRAKVAVVPGPPVVNPEAVAALRDAYASLTGTGGDDHEGEPFPVELFDVWMQAIADHADAFRRTEAPLGQLLAEAGLATEEDQVATADFDWRQWRIEVVLDQVAQRFQLDELGVQAWVVVGAAYAHFAAGDLEHSREAEAPLGDALSYGNVAPAFVATALPDLPDADGSVAAFAEWVMARSSRQEERAGPLWVRSICAERDGKAVEAEAFLVQALAADPDYEPALADAAWYAADRGDARRAASLLRRGGLDDDDHLLEVYDRFARTPPAQVGRNDPCPCGSGRKYKFCHLGQGTLPLTERCAFLYQKGASYLMRYGLERVFHIAEARIGYRPDPVELDEALEDPLVGDLALFEDAVWDDFLRDRGPLLPADELLLGQLWRLVERSLHEIQSVRPGQGLTARDLRTGNVVEVTERSASRELKVGDLICARIVPDGAGYQVFGGIERVPLRQRDQWLALLDRAPSGVEVAAWFAAAHEPPQLRNYEHEPMVACTRTYRVSDPAAAAATLNQILEPSTAGEWVETVETEGWGRTIRGVVRLDDASLTVDTNSEARAERLGAVLESKVEGLQLVDDVRIPAAEVLTDRASQGPMDEAMDLPGDVDEAMDQHIREYERRWLDMSIPALAGLTPRQAADDPTRRADLLALLHEFERMAPSLAGRGTTMSADRLRTMLGLD